MTVLTALLAVHLCVRYIEVQVAVHSVGICGSDVHYWTHGQIWDFVLRAPMLLGHESAGTVTKLGPGVKNLQIGQLQERTTCWSLLVLTANLVTFVVSL